MRFSNYLKEFFPAVVEWYRKFFLRTSGTALIFTIIYFVVTAVLLKYTNFSSSGFSKPMSLLSYIFSRFSFRDIYSLVDLSKTALLFFASLFTVALIRMEKIEEEKKELGFGAFLRNIKPDDCLWFVAIFLACSAIDFGIFKLETIFAADRDHEEFYRWLNSILFLLRVYIPLILFSLIMHYRTSENRVRLSFKKMFFLFAALFLFNETGYTIFYHVRNDIFTGILISASDEKKYFFESFLGLPLIAFLFFGYGATMNVAVKLLEEPQ